MSLVKTGSRKGTAPRGEKRCRKRDRNWVAKVRKTAGFLPALQTQQRKMMSLRIEGTKEFNSALSKERVSNK